MDVTAGYFSFFTPPAVTVEPFSSMLYGAYACTEMLSRRFTLFFIRLPGMLSLPAVFRAVHTTTKYVLLLTASKAIGPLLLAYRCYRMLHGSTCGEM